MFRFSPIVEMIKAEGHMYLKKIPIGTTKTGRTKYRYVYRTTQTHRGKHFLDPEQMVENASFMYRRADGAQVHARITSVIGDKITYVLDDGPNEGKEVKTTKERLAEDLIREHDYQDQIEDIKEEDQRDLSEALETGSAEAIAAARREVEKYRYIGDEPEKEEAKKKEQPKRKSPPKRRRNRKKLKSRR